ncbi:unnamed protein product [Didymodactylos carnosus]|uniref:Uncharacterized protein n=1 Tax=Didymodactylos carnosus TaxID=1234261 RepID=A0A815Y1T2_9BILA|nr:unnamed protein product [Didymodactylos carnosus]CAF4426525.1 unnamed protein product [Didymodactylos carnosus]
MDDNVETFTDLSQQLVVVQHEWNDMDMGTMQAEAIEDLKQVAGTYGLADDPQTILFIDLIASATHYASTRFTTRFKHYLKMINITQQLAREIEKETKEFKDIASAFDQILRKFIDEVVEIQREAAVLLPLLKQVSNHLGLIQKILSSFSTDTPGAVETLDNGKIIAIKISVRRLGDRARDFHYRAQSKRNEISLLKTKIHLLHNKVEEKKNVTDKRMHFLTVGTIGGAVGGAIGGSVAGGAIGGTALGSAGALVIAGSAFPPVGAVFIMIGVGAISIGGILALIQFIRRRKFRKYQETAQKYLECISAGLDDMSRHTDEISQLLSKTSEKSMAVSLDMENIEDSLLSPAHAEMNSGICQKANQSTKETIECLEHICDFKWYNILENHRQAILPLT